MNSAQRYREFMTVPQIPGTGPNIQDFFSNRQFDQIRGGPESGAFGVRGLPQGVMQLTPEQQLQLYLETEGGDVDIEDVNRFQPQNFFQKGLDFFQNNPGARTGLGFLLGGIPGAALSFFAPRIGEGITNLFNRTQPAANVPIRNIGDMDMSDSSGIYGGGITETFGGETFSGFDNSPQGIASASAEYGSS